MPLYRDFDSYPRSCPTVISVGSFDGVHAGHRRLIDRLRAMASRLMARSVVVSFEPHPRIAMGRAEGMSLLTSVEERVELLARLGVDDVVIARFDEEFRSQSYEEFVGRCLVGGLSMRGMVVGYNHRFGRAHEGNFSTLAPLATALGFEVEQVAQYTDSGDKVSSTVIRELIAAGDMLRATAMLNHPYLVIGDACRGVVCVEDSFKMLPPIGRYRACVSGDAMAVGIENRNILLDMPLEGRVIVEFMDRI